MTKELASQVIQALDNEKSELELKFDQFSISLSNLNKALWPGTVESGGPVTKRDYVRYLCQTSEYLLAHLKDRPLTLIRYPNGVHGKAFFQKHWKNKLPPYMETIKYFSEHNGGDEQYLLCSNLFSLLWCGQMAALELHTSHSRIDPNPDATGIPTLFTGNLKNIESSILNYPDFLILDLDPYLYSGKEAKGAEPELHRAGFQKVRELALMLKQLLDNLNLAAYVKTSGKTGLHIYVPVIRKYKNEDLRAIAATIAKHAVSLSPDEISIDWAVKKRTGKVFFDYNMNARHKTLAAPYSPRNSDTATVSLPVRWDELNDIYPEDFTIRTAPHRLEKVGDLWVDILSRKNNLENLLSTKKID